MDISKYPGDVQKYMREMIRLNVIDGDAADMMLINYLSTQKYDEDYIKSMMRDRQI